MSAGLTTLICSVVYVGLWAVAAVVTMRDMNPLLALPPLSGAFAALSYLPRNLRKIRDRYRAVMDAGDVDALVRVERVGNAVASLVGAVGVWAVVVRPTPWISHRILAITSPDAPFYYAQYSALSTLLLAVGSIAASILISNVLVPRLAGPRRDLWRRHAGTMTRKAVTWASSVILVISLAALPVFLAAGASVTEKGIVLHKLWHSQPSFHGWNDVRKVGVSDGHDGFYVEFTDGSVWTPRYSLWDPRSHPYDIVDYVAKRTKRQIEYE
ncbi:MAG: hypothetical protein Q7T82_14115 [Armatimonadota bacterium]|nr:hypothetical protein [Armatimonadota bacterium]